MNAALLYRRRRPWTFWIAFTCAAAIHVGAVVLAKGKSEKTTIQDFTTPTGEVEVLDTDPERVPPEEPVTPPPAQFSPDEEIFSEENRTPRPLRPRRKTPMATVVRAAARGAAPRFGSVKALVTYAPRPVYPYEARRQRITGSGVVLVTVASEDGRVIDARMGQSSGSVILDNATLEAFRRWRFKPGAVSMVQVPITYTLTGASY
ncbi:MAG TPA: energy transducer TonB [Candidatus Udaeobacter sp.]|jgi:TonB family protein